jgi:branched-chain amino acid transport system ATP-binding protein
MRATGLRKAFDGQVVLKDVDLELREREVVLLRGDNGSGKTTLLNILTGNLEPDSGSLRVTTNGIEEEFLFPRHWWQDLNPFDHFTPERVAKKGIGRSWQGIRLFSSQSLRDNVALAVPGHPGETPLNVIFRPSVVMRFEQSVSAASSTTLAKLGLAGRLDASGDKVSMGQARRVAIARAVQAGARLLMLDEPLASLDAAGAHEVTMLLKELAHRHDVTLVIIEHVLNAPIILDFATSVWTLNNGTIEVQTPAQEGAALNNACPNEVPAIIRTSLTPSAKLVGEVHLEGARLSLFARTDARPEPPLLEVTDLVVHRGTRLIIGTRTERGVIRGLSFSLSRGTVGVLLAPNGWGKTTLLEAIAGLVPITAGEIRLSGKPIEELPPWQRAALGISFLQSRNHEYLNLTVEEVAKLARLSVAPASIHRFLRRKMSELSGGEKQKVAALLALTRQPSIFAMLDEPFSGLDRNAVDEVSSLLCPDDRSASLLALPSTIT